VTKTPSTLTDACEFIVDCLHATAPIQDLGYPLIRTPNIGKGRLDLNGVQRVSEDTYEKWTRRAVPVAGDLILAREAPAGNVAVVSEGETVCLGQRTVHLRPDKSRIDPLYLCYFLLSPHQQSLLLAGERGATSKHVNMKDIRKLPLTGLPRLGNL
jgi:type I restriction enzyme, S subunit